MAANDSIPGVNTIPNGVIHVLRYLYTKNRPDSI